MAPLPPAIRSPDAADHMGCRNRFSRTLWNCWGKSGSSPVRGGPAAAFGPDGGLKIDPPATVAGKHMQLRARGDRGDRIADRRRRLARHAHQDFARILVLAVD